MFLRFTSTDGKPQEIHLAGRVSVTIGRSTDVDISVPNTRVSRLHAEIRLWDGDFVIKDLKSRNGTFINDSRIDVAVLKPGDVIQVGPLNIHYGKVTAKGTQTIVREVTREIEEGNKGYRTILREIVKSTEPKPRKP